MRLNFLFCFSKASSLELFFLIHLLFCISPHYLSVLLSVYFAAHLPLLSVRLKMKELSLHFRLGVAAEGWYPTAIVGLCPAQEWWGGLAHLSEEGREEEGGGSSDAFALLLSPLACSKKARRKADAADAGGCRRAEGGGYKAAWDGISQCCRWLLLVWGKSESCGSPLAKEVRLHSEEARWC